jgi:hypothetical protein
MAGADSFLPPVVVEITATDKAFVAKLAADKALLLDFAKQITNAQIGVDSAKLQADLLTVKTEMLTFANELKNAKLGLDAVPFWTELAALRAEVQGLSPLDINIDVHTAAAIAKIALLKEDLKTAQLGAMMTPDLGLINANIAKMFASSGGGEAAGGGGGFMGFVSRLFPSHITGGHLAALGVPTNIARWLGPTLPLVTSFATSLFASAAGMVALGLAAGPTAFGIGQGALAIHTANKALSQTLVGGPGWQTAIENLGAAWAAVPVPLQAAVAKITSIFSGNSAIGQQAGNWLNSIIDGMHIHKGALSKIFMPLVVATENALNKVGALFSKAFGSGKFAGMIQSLAAMVGPAIAAFASIGGSLIKIGQGFASIGMGGQGMKFIAQFFQFLAQIATSSLFEGALSGFVQFDRGVITVAGYLLKLVDVVSKFVLNGPLLGPIVKALIGGFMGLSAAMWLANGPVGTFIGSMIAAAGTAATMVGEMLVSFAAWIAGMVGVEGASVAMNIIIAGTVVGLVLVLVALLVELALHWKTVWADIQKVFGGVIQWFKKYFGYFGTEINTIKHAWDSLFGGGAANSSTNKRAATVAAANKALKDQAAHLKNAAKNANQYANALNGIYPKTQYVTGATQNLIKAEEQIGPAIAKQRTGFATFAQAATQTYAQMMANIQNQNATISTEMAAAQQLIMKGIAAGLNPAQVEAAVASMAKEVPQQLLVLNKESAPKIKAMIQQYSDLTLSAQTAGSKTGFDFTTKVMQGLNSAVPQTRAWAQQELKILGINTLPVGKQIALGIGLGISSGQMKALLESTKLGKALIASLTNNTNSVPVGEQIAAGLAMGMSNRSMNVLKVTGSIAGNILKTMRHTVQSHSPSQAMATIGKDLMDGLIIGMTGKKGPVNTTITNLANGLLKLLHPYIAKFTTLGSQLMQGLAAGIISATNQVVQAAVNAANQALAATKAATKTASPSQLYAEQGRNWMLGLVQGIQSGTGLVQGAMVGSLPRVGAAGGMGMGMGAGLQVHATFQIIAPGGNPEAIKSVIAGGAAQEFAHQVLVSMQSGAGSVY